MLDLQEVVNLRYAKESSCCSSLSCGGALDLSQPKNGEIFIDLGCGRGNDVLKAARSVGESGKAYGVDFTDEMLHTAESNRKKLKIENAEFIKSPIESLPFSENHADVVISNCTINHSPKKDKVFSEILRILKPGGRAIISDVLSEGYLPEEVVNDPEAWAGCYGGAIPKDDYFRIVINSGFPSIDILEESVPYEKGGVMVKSITIQLNKPKGGGQ